MGGARAPDPGGAALLTRGAPQGDLHGGLEDHVTAVLDDFQDEQGRVQVGVTPHMKPTARHDARHGAWQQRGAAPLQVQGDARRGAVAGAGRQGGVVQALPAGADLSAPARVLRQGATDLRQGADIRAAAAPPRAVGGGGEGARSAVWRPP